jgi:hypothetical protein
MKHLKMLGLAAMAIAALSAFSVASASATELYSGATTLGHTTITGSLTKGTSAELKTTGGTLLDTCTGSDITITATPGGGTGVPVVGHVTNLQWTGCTKTTDTLELGTLEVAYTSGLNGTLSGKGFKVTVAMSAEFGGTCSYTLGTGGTTVGEAKGSTTGPATLVINATVNGASGNSFLCPSDTKWIANYTATSPSPLHVTNS